MSTVLIVEDNEPLSKKLAVWLGKHYKVTIANNGKKALKSISKEDFQLIIIDLGLPDMTGQEVCQEIRSRGIKTPVLILTANDEIAVKVSLLDQGADDYLLKPFYVGELQARVRALLRRGSKSEGTSILKVGDLTMDVARRQVEREGVTINLRRKEFDILEYLMHNRGTVVTRSMIINNTWEAGADRWNNTVDVHIKYLRDKVDRPFKKPLIKTAYGVGYMIDD